MPLSVDKCDTICFMANSFKQNVCLFIVRLGSPSFYIIIIVIDIAPNLCLWHSHQSLTINMLGYRFARTINVIILSKPSDKIFVVPFFGAVSKLGWWGLVSSFECFCSPSSSKMHSLPVNLDTVSRVSMVCSVSIALSAKVAMTANWVVSHSRLSQKIRVISWDR